MNPTLAIVSLCVNDDYGDVSEHVSSAHFSTGERGYDTMPVLELESPWLFMDEEDEENPHPVFVEGEYAFTIDGETFPFFLRREHVGNIYWNGYAVLTETAQRLAAHLVGLGWTVDAETMGQPFYRAVA